VLAGDSLILACGCGRDAPASEVLFFRVVCSVLLSTFDDVRDVLSDSKCVELLAEGLTGLDTLMAASCLSFFILPESASPVRCQPG